MEEQAEMLRGLFFFLPSQVTCVCVCVCVCVGQPHSVFLVTQCLPSTGADGIFLTDG